MEVTDPETYNRRDLLIFLQLLYDANLIEQDTINSDNSKLDEISSRWYNHKGTQLSIAQGADRKPLTVKQMVKLYENLIDKYGCGNTTELANVIYSERIEELEKKLASSQGEFSKLINA